MKAKKKKNVYKESVKFTSHTFQNWEHIMLNKEMLTADVFKHSIEAS